MGGLDMSGSRSYAIPDLPRFRLDPRAACHHANPHLFFPPPGYAGVEQARQARAVCHTCPLQAECCEYGIQHREWGIWGGLTETERNNIWRRRRQAEHLARVHPNGGQTP